MCVMLNGGNAVHFDVAADADNFANAAAGEEAACCLCDAERGNAVHAEVAAVKARSKKVDRDAVCDVDLSIGFADIECKWVMLKAGNRQKKSRRVSAGTRGTATHAERKAGEVASSKSQAEKCVSYLGL